MADQQQQQGGVPHRVVFIPNILNYTKEMKVVTLVDRRVNPPPPPQEWLFQTDLEDLLYPATTTDGTNGAFYRLLNRSDAGRGKALSLRRASIAAGMLTEAEFDTLKGLLHTQVRVFTLVPLEAVGMALATYGCTPASEALLTAPWDCGGLWIGLLHLLKTRKKKKKARRRRRRTRGTRRVVTRRSVRTIMMATTKGAVAQQAAAAAVHDAAGVTTTMTSAPPQRRRSSTP